MLKQFRATVPFFSQMCYVGKEGGSLCIVSTKNSRHVYQPPVGPQNLTWIHKLFKNMTCVDMQNYDTHRFWVMKLFVTACNFFGNKTFTSKGWTLVAKRGRACVCVCVTMKKSARRMASTTSDTGNTSSKQQQAERKENYNKCVCVCVCLQYLLWTDEAIASSICG